MAEQKKHMPISKLVLEAKRCPISGLWPHLYPTPDGTYYFTCSPLCPWDASKSTSYSALCTYEKNTYKPVYTGAHAHADISDAVAEWNDLMTAKTKYERGDDTMLKVNPCPISGLTPEPNHWADDAWFYECDSRCPRIKNCRLATPVYVHQTDAEAGWNRLVKDVTAGEAGFDNSGAKEPASTRTIDVKLSCFTPSVKMTITIPDERDDEEYINELLGSMLAEEFRYNVEWDFADA